jgi:hypothetical protein
LAIDKKLKELVDFESIHKDYKNYFIKLLMSSDYFDFANKPKEFTFHNYGTYIAT